MIPEQVRRQAEEADRLQQQIAAQQSQTAEAEPEPEPEPQPEPTAGAQGEAQETSSPKPTEQKSDQSVWEQRYYSLKGKYDAEVGPLMRQNRELQQQLQALSAQVEQLAKLRNEPERKPEPENPGVTPQDVETFGQDLIDLIQRVARGVVNSLVKPLSQELEAVKQLTAQLQGTLEVVEDRSGKAAQDTFVRKLTELVPDWQKINVEQQFLLWLEEPDPISGIVRKQLLNAAAERLEVQRVAALFKAYKAWKAEQGLEEPTPPPPPPPPPAPTPVTPQRRLPIANPEISAQVAPGKSRSSTPVPQSDPSTRIWTQAEIRQFYEDVKLGRFRGTPEDVARIEAEIDLAAAQGRIRP